MGFRFYRRINLGGGAGLNLSKSGISPSYRTKYGSIGPRGFSVRTGIPGLSYRGSRRGAGQGAAFIALVMLAIAVISIVFIVLWTAVRFIAWATVEGYHFYLRQKLKRQALQANTQTISMPPAGSAGLLLNGTPLSGNNLAVVLPTANRAALVPLSTGTGNKEMSEEFAQVGFDADVGDLINNPEQRCPCLLILDTSGSMSGRPIEELNAGLLTLQSELNADSLASKRVEISIVSFGPVEVKTEFTSADVFSPPSLSASGATPMGQAIETGLELLNARKASYRKAGVPYYRPWVFLITDGGPTDSISNAKSLIAAGEEKKAFMFYTVGVDGADMGKLSECPPSGPMRQEWGFS